MSVRRSLLPGQDTPGTTHETHLESPQRKNFRKADADGKSFEIATCGTKSKVLSLVHLCDD